MRPLLRLAALLAPMLVGGCADQSFMCGPAGNWMDMDPYPFMTPATTAGTGYLHCPPPP